MCLVLRRITDTEHVNKKQYRDIEQPCGRTRTLLGGSPRSVCVGVRTFAGNPRPVRVDSSYRQFCMDDIGAITHELQAESRGACSLRREADSIIDYCQCHQPRLDVQ